MHLWASLAVVHFVLTLVLESLGVVVGERSIDASEHPLVALPRRAGRQLGAGLTLAAVDGGVEDVGPRRPEVADLAHPGTNSTNPLTPPLKEGEDSPNASWRKKAVRQNYSSERMVRQNGCAVIGVTHCEREEVVHVRGVGRVRLAVAE